MARAVPVAEAIIAVITYNESQRKNGATVEKPSPCVLKWYKLPILIQWKRYAAFFDG